jgi:hypothetical protein
MKIIISLIFMLFTLASCSSGGSQQKPISSASSSSETIVRVGIQYIFPLNFSNIGGGNSTEIVLKIVDAQYENNTTSIQIDGVNFTKSESSNIWISDTSLDLSENTNSINLQPIISLDNGATISGTSLTLSNTPISQAGSGVVQGAEKLALDVNNNALYVSSPSAGYIYRIALQNATQSQVFVRTLLTGEANTLTWPLAIDSNSDVIFYDFDSAGIIIKINRESFEIVSQTPVTGGTDTITDIIFDNRNLADQEGIYFLDSENSDAITFLDSQFASVFLRPVTPLVGEDAEFFASLFRQDMHYSIRDQALYLLRQKPFSQSTFGSILKVVTFSDEDIGLVFQQTKAVDLNSGGYTLTGALTMAESNIENEVYIAESNKIWSVNLIDNTINIITSTSVVPGMLGQGPAFGADVSSMVVHPETGIIFLAAGSRGLFAINPETGNRILVSN